MNKILFLILISFSLLYSQDKEPNSLKFRWGDSQSLRPFEPDSFKQNNILTGFQWNGSLIMNNALYNNVFANHGYDTVATGSRVYPLLLINQPRWQDKGYNIGAWNAPFMQYEPTLPLNSINNGTILRPSDQFSN